MDDVLVKRITEGDVQGVEGAIASGANVNHKFRYRSSVDGIDGIIESIYDDKTPLLLAANLEDLDIVNILIEAGAEVNAQSKYDGDTALGVAVKSENVAMIESLFRAGANPSIASTYDGDTPLIAAVRLGNDKIVKSLVNAGADINQESGKGLTPLDVHMLNREYDVKIKEFLEENGAVHNVDNYFSSMQNELFDSIYKGDLSSVKYWIDQNPSLLNDKNSKGQLPIVEAVKGLLGTRFTIYHSVDYEEYKEAVSNFIDIIDLFIKNGVDLNKHDSLERTALTPTLSFAEGYDIKEKLIKAGADIKLYSFDCNVVTPKTHDLLKQYGGYVGWAESTRCSVMQSTYLSYSLDYDIESDDLTGGVVYTLPE